MMSDTGAAPKLRFPEFRDAEGWKEKKLKNLGALVPGLTYRPSDVRNEGLLVLRSSNIQNGLIDLEDQVFVRTDVKGANLSRPDDILICVRNGSKPLIGKNALIPEGLPLCTHGAFMTIFRSTAPKFTFQLFQTDAYTNQVTADLGATINSINGGNFLNYRFHVPSPPEQQKIADCLTSVDDLITAETQKLEALKAHKKGLMQQLFPREGETKPRLRFPVFRDAGDWEEKKLRKICTMNAGEFVPASKIAETAEDGLFSCYGGNGLRGFTETYTHQGTFSLIGRQGALCGNIALAKGKFHATEHAIVTSPKDGTLTNWLYYQLIRLDLNQYATGQAQPGLSVKNLNEITVPIPKDEGEQQRIADCLISVDDLITAEARKLEALKDHKKGLMQQLFPTGDEVSG